MNNNYVNAAVVSGEYDFISVRLRELGINPIKTSSNIFLQTQVSYHPDMQLLNFKNRTFVLGGDGGLAENLKGVGHNVTELSKPGSDYPKDVICNAKLVGNKLFCNANYIDSQILDYCTSNGISVINVKQGYTGCSICKLTDDAIITSDNGIAAKAIQNGIETLFVDSNDISLPGYNCGFIGGCTGLISKDVLAFSGDLNEYSFGTIMRDFCIKHDIRIIEICNGKPLDIGGIVPIF